MELAVLKESLQKLAPTTTTLPSLGDALAITPVLTGISALDDVLLLGGLPAGRITEIVGASSSGKTALGLRLLAEQTRTGKLVAFVDGTGQLYPPAAAAIGVDLCRMLLIAPKHTGRATQDPVARLARATEIITRCRAFAMVVLDLPGQIRVQRTPARRLRIATQSTGTTLVVLSNHPEGTAIEGAATRIEAYGHRQRTHLHVTKGAQGMSARIELNNKRHRFDDYPPRKAAPIQYRTAPGEEPVECRANPYQATPSYRAHS